MRSRGNGRGRGQGPKDQKDKSKSPPAAGGAAPPTPGAAAAGSGLAANVDVNVEEIAKTIPESIKWDGEYASASLRFKAYKLEGAHLWKLTGLLYVKDPHARVPLTIKNQSGEDVDGTIRDPSNLRYRSNLEEKYSRRLDRIGYFPELRGQFQGRYMPDDPEEQGPVGFVSGGSLTNAMQKSRRRNPSLSHIKTIMKDKIPIIKLDPRTPLDVLKYRKEQSNSFSDNQNNNILECLEEVPDSKANFTAEATACKDGHYAKDGEFSYQGMHESFILRNYPVFLNNWQTYVAASYVREWFDHVESYECFRDMVDLRSDDMNPFTSNVHTILSNMRDFLEMLDESRDAHSLEVLKILAIEGCSCFFPLVDEWAELDSGPDREFMFTKVRTSVIKDIMKAPFILFITS